MLEPRSVYIAFEVFPRPKGASSHMASMLRALENKHGPVLLLCLGIADMPGFQQEGKILIRRCKLHHPNMLKRAQFFAQFVAQQLEGFSHTLELAVFRDPWGGLPAVAGPFAFKTVFEVNALPSWEIGYTYPEFDRNFALKHKIMDMEQCCLDRCNSILTVSDITAQALAGKGISKEKIQTIPNSAPEFFFKGTLTGTADSPKKDIGYIGSLHAWQGVEDALSAFAMIKPGYPEANLSVISAGHKKMRKKIQKRIQKMGLETCVVLHHPLPRHQLIDELCSFEFTLAPLKDTPRNTRQGCCPVKIIESMAAGVPVLASNLAPVRALINHGRDGWLVTAGKPRDLAIGMDTLLANKELTRSLGKKAGQRAFNTFHPRHIHRQLTRCFERVLTS